MKSQLILIAILSGRAAALDLRNAHVAADPNLTGTEKKAAQMLVEEVERRTALQWTLGAGAGPTIRLHHATGNGPAEGFHLSVRGNTVDIQGNDARGTLFGVGRFLRALRWDHLRLEEHTSELQSRQ